MTSAAFTLSAFGDEIADDPEVQLAVLAEEGIYGLELRGAWGRNVLDLDAGQVQRLRAMLDAARFTVSAIGSPIGKSTLDRPAAYELERLDRALAMADAFATRMIRVFSFYIPADAVVSARAEVIARLQQLVARAERAGVMLVHENERDIYGDVPERCRDLLDSIDSAAFTMAFDPANFVQVGIRPMIDAWPLLADRVTHVHIKDSLFRDRSVTPAGQGDGDIPGLLAALNARGYRGYLTLEPHLQIAGPAGGFSGEAGMRVAARALRGLLE